MIRKPRIHFPGASYQVIAKGALGGSVVGYLAKELANHPFKETAAHFNRDPVVISKGIKGLEKKIREEKIFI